MMDIDQLVMMFEYGVSNHSSVSVALERECSFESSKRRKSRSCRDGLVTQEVNLGLPSFARSNNPKVTSGTPGRKWYQTNIGGSPNARAKKAAKTSNSNEPQGAKPSGTVSFASLSRFRVQNSPRAPWASEVFAGVHRCWRPMGRCMGALFFSTLGQVQWITCPFLLPRPSQDNKCPL
jgi:hypothetical protein